MLIIRQLKLPIWRHRSSNYNSVSIATPAHFKPTTFTLQVLQVTALFSSWIPSTQTVHRVVCFPHYASKRSPLHPDAATALRVWVKSPDWPSVRGRHLRPREKGKFQSFVSDLAEVVAGHGPLHHVLSIHLEDVITAVRDERSVRQRHTLVAEGDNRVSLEGGSTHQSTIVSIPHYAIWLIAGKSSILTT